MSEESKNWIVTIANSEAGGIITAHFAGTEEEMKKAIFNLAAEDRNKNFETYDYGIDTPEDVDCSEDGREISVSVGYEDHHVAYTAIEESRIEELDRSVLLWSVPLPEEEEERE